ncbi:hypothetical protein ACNKU7_05705 [Microbulbifer sp. SA54]|uniref:hypothetical protein n=1 Tax=Microbulbifer sp. SA54 TaxID=3401577 RepID=UPI003AB03A66
MKDRYVIDTNVLIAASAANPSDPKDIDATPAEPEQRMRVWNWLSEFQDSPSRMVLDRAGGIYSEYNNKLGFNDYGIQVVMHKWSTVAVDNVDVEYDAEGHGLLNPPLRDVIHDEADKKMVAAALDSHAQYGEGCVAFAGDTDWHDWEADLLASLVLLEPIIEDWSRQKHTEKQNR